MTYTSKLRVERVLKGLSQLELGIMTSIPPYRVSLLERGINPKPEEELKLSKFLNCKAEDLFPSIRGNQEKTISGILNEQSL